MDYPPPSHHAILTFVRRPSVPPTRSQTPPQTQFLSLPPLGPLDIRRASTNTTTATAVDGSDHDRTDDQPLAEIRTAPRFSPPPQPTALLLSPRTTLPTPIRHLVSTSLYLSLPTWPPSSAPWAQHVAPRSAPGGSLFILVTKGSHNPLSSQSTLPPAQMARSRHPLSARHHTRPPQQRVLFGARTKPRRTDTGFLFRCAMVTLAFVVPWWDRFSYPLLPPPLSQKKIPSRARLIRQ